MKPLLTIIGLVLLAAGPAALLAPESAAAAFGIPIDGAASRAYLLATATRDVALGALLLALLRADATRRVLATTVLAIAVVAAGDAANVMGHASSQSWPALIVHVGGLVVLLAIGWRMWRSGDA
jgi:hypothetical protein